MMLRAEARRDSLNKNSCIEGAVTAFRCTTDCGLPGCELYNYGAVAPQRANPTKVSKAEFAPANSAGTRKAVSATESNQLALLTVECQLLQWLGTLNE